MRTLIIILVLIVTSCKRNDQKAYKTEKPKYEKIKNSEFELINSDKQNGLLILFPCLPCDAQNTFSEFKIEEISVKNGFSVLAMNFNQRLFLNQSEKQQLTKKLEK